MDGVNKFAEVDRWKEYFDTTGEDVFEIIDFAIKVAYRYRPAGLLQHRCNLAQLLFSRFEDSEISDCHPKESKEDTIAIQPNDKVEANQGHKLKIKLKLPTRVVLSSNPKQEEKINKVSEDLAKEPTESKKNEKNLYIPTIKSKSNDDAEAKIHAQLSGTTNQVPFKDSEMNEDPKTSSTNSELRMHIEKATLCAEAEMSERKIEANKRRIEDRYIEFESARKRIRTEDTKYTPKPMKLIRVCGKSFKRRPLIYHIRRTTA